MANMLRCQRIGCNATFTDDDSPQHFFHFLLKMKILIMQLSTLAFTPIAKNHNKTLQSRADMDRYQRVEKPRTDAPINENEISITTQGRMWNYITYAITLVQVFFFSQLEEEKGSDEIFLKAMGRAINKTVIIAELIKDVIRLRGVNEPSRARAWPSSARTRLFLRELGSGSARFELSIGRLGSSSLKNIEARLVLELDSFIA
ncbi:hypothetical protein LXL04_025271 [Taraxacum kok-saghyz]